MPNTVSADKLFITSVDKITAFNNANEVEFILDEIQDCTISNSQDNTDITGKNGTIIGTLKRNKAVTISGNNGFNAALDCLSAQTGSDVQVGSYVIRTMEILDVASNTVTITREPQGAEGAELLLSIREILIRLWGKNLSKMLQLSPLDSFLMTTKF